MPPNASSVFATSRSRSAALVTSPRTASAPIRSASRSSCSRRRANIVTFAPSSASASAAARPSPDEAPQTIAVLPRRPRSIGGTVAGRTGGRRRRTRSRPRTRSCRASSQRNGSSSTSNRSVVYSVPGPVVARDAAGDALRRLERLRRVERAPPRRRAGSSRRARSRSRARRSRSAACGSTAAASRRRPPRRGRCSSSAAALRLVAALVDVQDDAPRRAGLVVVVANRRAPSRARTGRRRRSARRRCARPAPRSRCRRSSGRPARCRSCGTGRSPRSYRTRSSAAMPGHGFRPTGARHRDHHARDVTEIRSRSGGGPGRPGQAPRETVTCRPRSALRRQHADDVADRVALRERAARSSRSTSRSARCPSGRA